MDKKILKLQKTVQKAMKKAEYSKALDAYQQLVRLEPENLRNWVNAGDLFRRVGQIDKAVGAYGHAAARYAVKGELVKAISLNKMILELDPDHEQTQKALAVLYSRSRKADRSTVRQTGSSKSRKGVAAAGNDKPALKPIAVDFADNADKSVAGKSNDQSAPQSDWDDFLGGDSPPADGPVVETVPVDDDDPEVVPLEDHEVEELQDWIRPKPVWDEADAHLEGASDGSNLDEMVNDLPHIPIFSDLSPEEFQQVIGHIHLLRIGEGEAVVEEGESGDSFFVIASGTADVEKRDPLGKPVLLAELEAGGFFGEFAFLTGTPRTASVIATEAVEVLEFTRDALQSLIDSHPSIQIVLEQFYDMRLVQTMLKINPIFQALPEDERDQVLSKMRLMEAHAGDTLIQQGTVSDGVYFVLAGKVDVLVHGNNDAQPVNVAQLSTGDYFGEISLISGDPTTASCVVAESTRMYMLPSAEFVDLIETHPEVLDRVSEIAGDRLEHNRTVLTAHM